MHQQPGRQLTGKSVAGTPLEAFIPTDKLADRVGLTPPSLCGAWPICCRNCKPADGSDCQNNWTRKQTNKQEMSCQTSWQQNEGQPCLFLKHKPANKHSHTHTHKELWIIKLEQTMLTAKPESDVSTGGCDYNRRKKTIHALHMTPSKKSSCIYTEYTRLWICHFW